MVVFLRLLAFLFVFAEALHGQQTATFLTLWDSGYAPLFPGKERTYTPEDSTFAVSRSRGGVAIAVQTKDGLKWKLECAGPASGPLGPGAYSPAGSNFYHDDSELEIPTQAFLRFEPTPFTNVVGQRGDFEVHKMTYGPAGEVLSCRITFTIYSISPKHPLRGEFQYRADDTTVSTNQAPTVFVGAAATAQAGVAVPLQATVGDDQTGPPNVQWTTAAGPVDALFSTAGDFPTVTFPQPGSYTIRATAIDKLNPALTGSDDHVITVREVLPNTSFTYTLLETPEYSSRREVSTTLTSSDAAFSIESRTGGGFRVKIRGADDAGRQGETYDLEFSGPNGTLPTAGIYHRSSSVFQERPIFDLVGLTYHTDAEGFAVRQIEFGSNGEVTRLWLTFTQAQLDEKRFITGELRYRLTDDPTAANLPPVATAGNDESIEILDALVLHGAATDDILLGTELPVLWEKVSGPGEAFFARPNDPQTSVQFSAPGVYVLRFKASDGVQIGSDEMQVTVGDLECSLALRVEAPGEAAAEYFFTPATGLTRPSRDDDQIELGTNTDAGATKDFRVSLFVPETSGQIGPGSYAVAASSPDPQPRLIFQRFEGVAHGGAGSSFVIQRLSSPGYPVDLCHLTFELIEAGNGLRVTGELRWKVARDARNLPPLVRASLRTPAVDPGPIGLRGEVSDDGLPTGGTVQTRWSLREGPGKAKFAQANSAETTVTFSKAGRYDLVFTATDGLLSSAASLRIHVPRPQRRYAGLLANASGEGVGSLDLLVDRLGTFTGTVRLGSARYTLRGTFDAEETARKTIRLPNGSTISLQLRATENGLIVEGDTADGALTGEIPPSQFSSNPRQRPLAQQYLVFLRPDATEPTSPQGTGILSIRTSSFGQVRAAGHLADGTPLLVSGLQAEFYPWQFYAPLLNGRASLSGKISQFDHGSTVRWKCAPAAGAVRYAAGFDAALPFVGASLRFRPISGDALHNSTQVTPALLTLTHPFWNVPLVRRITFLNRRPTVLETPDAPEHLTLSRLDLSGLGTGFFRSATGAATKFSFGVRPEFEGGWGNFQIGGIAGDVRIQAEFPSPAR